MNNQNFTLKSEKVNNNILNSVNREYFGLMCLVWHKKISGVIKKHHILKVKSKCSGIQKWKSLNSDGIKIVLYTKPLVIRYREDRPSFKNF